MLSRYKSIAENNLQAVAKKLSWLNPNFITIIGIIPPILFLIFMNSHRWGWAIAMLILTPLDMIDGIVARANNSVTAFGGFLDSTMDRIGDFLIIAGLYAGGLISLPLAAVLLLVTFLISYARSRAELASHSNQIFNQGIIERPERILYILVIVIIFSLWPNVSLGGYNLTTVLITILILLSIITITQRVYAAYKHL
jgi:phosphatidylglycerophosphate synthase